MRKFERTTRQRKKLQSQKQIVLKESRVKVVKTIRKKKILCDPEFQIVTQKELLRAVLNGFELNNARK